VSGVCLALTRVQRKRFNWTGIKMRRPRPDGRGRARRSTVQPLPVRKAPARCARRGLGDRARGSAYGRGRLSWPVARERARPRTVCEPLRPLTGSDGRRCRQALASKAHALGPPSGSSRSRFGPHSRPRRPKPTSPGHRSSPPARLATVLRRSRHRLDRKGREPFARRAARRHHGDGLRPRPRVEFRSPDLGYRGQGDCCRPQGGEGRQRSRSSTKMRHG
jgi:hypothetical protein